jgi:hypothetical protein
MALIGDRTWHCGVLKRILSSRDTISIHTTRVQPRQASPHLRYLRISHLALHRLRLLHRLREPQHSALRRPQFQPSEAAELCWRTGPGPGYSRSLAERHLHSRYETTTRGLRVTLPRIVKDNRCRRLLLRIRAEGLLDWQILSALLAMVAKWQVEAKLGRPISPTSE